MSRSYRPSGAPFACTNVDDGRCADILYLAPETDASPVVNWLAGFTPEGSCEEARAGLASGFLEPVLSPRTILCALEGCGIAPTPEDRRSWGHIEAMLSTPHESVFVGVLLRDPPRSRLLLGLRHPGDGGTVPPDDVAAAVRVTLGILRAGLTEVPDLPPVPDLRPFRAPEGPRSFAQLAARKDVPVDAAGSLALDRLQDAAVAETRIMAAQLASGQIDVEGAYEREETWKRAWLIEAYRLVGADTVTAVLGRDAVPRASPPEAPGWPYWLRATVVAGRDTFGRRESMDLMLAIQYLCRNGGHAALDGAYRRIEVSLLSELALITLLRTPFTTKDRLKDWEAFRERVRAELFARGRDGDKVLVGLGGPGCRTENGQPLH